MTSETDVIVIGGGIVGLSMAWEAAKRGLAVTLIERSRLAEGASIRNFGMVWPIGQPAGEPYERALHSRSLWLDLRDQAGVWAQECGSLHVVYHNDEWAVLQEFAAKSKDLQVQCELLSAEEAVRRYPAVQRKGLLGALYSPSEMVVDPPLAIRRIPHFLAERYGVQLLFGRTVIGIDSPHVRLSDGTVLHAKQIFVCSGTDFETLFPKVMNESGIRKCKLQMMRTKAQPNGWRIGTHIAGGLTLGHYKSFQACESLPAMKQRHAAEYPEYGRLGIHVMASQNSVNEVIIGDSHEYDEANTPFDQPYIDELIMKYLRQMIDLPEWGLTARWHGIYAKHPEKTLFTAQPQPGCYIVNAPGGAGMTMSFGNAAYLWKELDSGRWPE
jgi:D-hydroxyproline dehydrogenase subunit beta